MVIKCFLSVSIVKVTKYEQFCLYWLNSFLSMLQLIKQILFKLKSVFTSHVPEAVLEKQAGAELSFLLPFNTSSAFPALFKTLDDQQDELAISGYGATITTLEEVFLRFVFARFLLSLSTIKKQSLKNKG